MEINPNLEAINEANFGVQTALVLMQEGRCPTYEIAVRGLGMNQAKGMMFHIPPEGVQPDDTVEIHDGTRTYTTKDGKSRGNSTPIWLPLDKGRDVRRAIESEQRRTGADKTSGLAFMIGRSRRYLKEVSIF